MQVSPPDPSSLPKVNPSLTSNIPNEKEKSVESTTLPKLPSIIEPAKKRSSWWSWMKWGKKDDEAIQQQKKERDGSSGLEEDRKEGLNGENPDDKKLEPDSEESKLVQLPSDDNLSDLTYDDFVFTIPDKPKNPVPLDVVADKTQDVGKSWLRRQGGNLLGGIKNGTQYVASGVGTKFIQTYSGIYGYFIGKEGEIAASKQIMRDQLNDPQYIELFDFVRQLAKVKVENFVKNYDQGFVGHNLKQHMGLIVELVEVNLARGFANLAVQLNSQKDQIPNYDEQPSFVNLLALISKKSSKHLDAELLKKFEEEYREARTTLRTLAKKLIPNFDSDPKNLALIQGVIQKGDLHRTIMAATAREAVVKLFPDYDTAQGERKADIEKFQESLLKLHQRDLELKRALGSIANEILECMFPNKFIDMKIPPVLPGSVMNFLFDFFAMDSIVSFLKECFEPMENDPNLVQEWENDLKARIGVPELGSLHEAPSAFVTALAKNFIQSDPKVVSMTAESLGSFFRSVPLSQEEKDKIKRINVAFTTPLSSEQLKRLAQLSNEQLDELSLLSYEDFKKRIVQITFFSQLSQEGLAGWLVQSVQTILQTDDPYLAGLGNFFQKGLNNLTLALLAQGSKLVMPAGVIVKEDQFFKELSDRIVKIFSSVPQVDLPDQVMIDFVYALPLPSFVKTQLSKLLIEQIKNMQIALKNTSPPLEIQKIFQESEQKILTYTKGKELLLITEKLSHQIVDQALEKKGDFISSMGLGNTVEELLAQYLPGVHINEDLIKWFKNNVTALGGSNGGPSTQYVAQLKLGMQVVLRMALINAIETNFKTNGGDYAAQLLGNIHRAFDKAIACFGQTQREQLDEALDIQEDIEEVKSQIQNLQKKLNLLDKPQNLTPEQQDLISEAMKAHVRQFKAEANLHILIDKRTEILEKLNQKSSFCTAEQLSIISEAVNLHQILSTTFIAQEQLLEEIQKRRADLATSPNKEEEEILDILVKLLDFPPEDHLLVLEVLKVEFTIQNASKEIDFLKEDVRVKTQAIEKFDIEKVGNAQDWENGKKWLKEIENSRQELSNLKKELALLLIDLDENLTPFQVLSKELFGLIGLDQKSKLHLPAFIQDSVWPIIEAAQNQELARILFEQLSPFIIPILDIDKNKDKLRDLSNGSQFLIHLAQNVSKGVVKILPDYVASYKSFANEILYIFGQAVSSLEEIERMEKALKQKMVELGKEGILAAMFNPFLNAVALPKDKEQAIGAALEQYIAQNVKNEISKDDILLLLKKIIIPGSQKDEQLLEEQSQKLSKNLNQFLLNRGKSRLTNQDLLDAYENQKAGNQKAVQPDQINAVLKDLEENDEIKRIQTVVITLDEIAVEINNLIPGATELHTLIGPQLENVINGQDQTLVANRDRLQNYIEGVLVSLFVKITESNQGKDRNVLMVLTRKLREMADHAHPIVGKKPEEILHELIDQLLADTLGIISEKDIEGIPSALQKVVYDKLKEQAYEQLTPMMLPILERADNRKRLREISGSRFMGNLCKAISADTFALIPDKAKPEQVAKLISSAAPFLEADFQKSIVNGIQELMHENPSVYEDLSIFGGSYIEGMLLRVFIRIAKKNPKVKGKDTFVILTERLLNIISKKYPELIEKFSDKDAFEKAVRELDNSILNDILGINSAEALKGLPEPFKETAYQMIKDQLGGMFIQLRKTLSAVGSNTDELRKVKEESKKLGIQDNSEESYLQILTNQLANKIMNAVEETFSERENGHLIQANLISKEVQSYLEELARVDMEMAKVLLNYTKGAEFQKLLEAKLSMIGNKNEFLVEKEKIAQLLSDVLIVPLHQFFNRVIDFEQEKGARFNQALMANIFQVAANHLKNINDARKLAADQGRTQILHKDYVEVAGANLHPGVPREFVTYQATVDAISKRIYGMKEPKQIYDKLKPEQQSKWIEEQKNLRLVFKAMSLKDSKGEKILNNKDIIKEINESHERITGFPLTKTQVKELSVADEKGLTLKDLIRQESEAPVLQRKKEAYTPTTKTLLKLLFPNGKKDLTFVPEELRGTVWNMFKKNLFPSLLPSLATWILEPDTIRSIVLSNLEATRDSMLPLKELPIESMISLYNKGQLISKETKEPATVVSKDELQKLIKEGKIIVNPEADVPVDEPMSALDRAAGALIAETLKTVKLPEWVKKKILDPKTGELPPAMQKTLGEAMRLNFNNHFIRDNLDLLLKKLGHRDEKGNAAFNTVPPEPGPDAKKAKELQLEQERSDVKSDLKRVSREVVDVSISYFIRNQWILAQARFDKLVKNTFGKIGTKLKNALDAVFRFIFFKIIGSLLSLLFMPVKGWVKEKIYDFISLDENRDLLIGFFERTPDSPSEVQHAVYNEDLIFKLGQALKETVEKVLDAPLLPMPLPADQILDNA